VGDKTNEYVDLEELLMIHTVSLLKYLPKIETQESFKDLISEGSIESITKNFLLSELYSLMLLLLPSDPTQSMSVSILVSIS